MQERAKQLTVSSGREKQFRCAFFNFTGGANGTGGWSYSGVQTEVINKTHVCCNAAHLTSLVVLVSIIPRDNDFGESPVSLYIIIEWNLYVMFVLDDDNVLYVC